MAKVEESAHQIKITVGPTGFERRMFFNRFSVLRIDEHAVVYFGLVDDSGVLRDCYACTLTKQTLNDNKASLTGLLAKIGAPKASGPKWVPPQHPMPTDLASVINAGVSIDAELLLFGFAIGPAVAKTKETSKPIEIDGIAMLRCSPELLKLLIAELYNSV